MEFTVDVVVITFFVFVAPALVCLCRRYYRTPRKATPAPKSTIVEIASELDKLRRFEHLRRLAEETAKQPASTSPMPPQPKPSPLRLPRFTKALPTAIEGFAELVMFAERKRELGEVIQLEDLPTIRNARGHDCVVLAATDHFSHLLADHYELQRRRAIVLPIPEAIA